MLGAKIQSSRPAPRVISALTEAEGADIPSASADRESVPIFPSHQTTS